MQNLFRLYTTYVIQIMWNFLAGSKFFNYVMKVKFLCKLSFNTSMRAQQVRAEVVFH